MSSDRRYSGDPYQTPVKLTNRQTTAAAQRPRVPRLDEDDENPNAWTTPKSPTSAIRRTGTGYSDSPKKTKLIKGTQHRIVKAAHPSPLSMAKFMGSKPYSAINAALEEVGEEPIDWQIPDR